MKYWRGYLIGGIIALLAYGINFLGSQYTTLVDMVYPYVSRTVQNFLVEWNSSVSFCLWQVALVVLLVLFLVSVVLMILLRWNPIQWFGWVLTAVAVIYLGNICIYGLNYHAGPIAEDIRLNVTDYTLQELEDATVYYRDLANEYAKQISRDGEGSALYPSFEDLSASAGDGFKFLTYNRSYSVFAGSREPVKMLGWADYYSSRGQTGITVGLTGEAAVNPDVPDVGIPFAMCREMARRMCIAGDRDAEFAAILASTAHSDKEFQYSGYLMAYRYCYNALIVQGSTEATNTAARILTGTNDRVRQDLKDYNAFFEGSKDRNAASYILISNKENGADVLDEVADLLVSWHIQEVVIPAQQEDAEDVFDPYDESQVDLSDIVGAMNNQKEESSEKETEE